MTAEQLNLKPGSWLVANCGDMPSESNCQLVMLAPEDQKEDLLAAGVQHAVNKHGHEDDENLRTGVESMITVVNVS
ncbi:MAG: hypothetical protein NVS1B10_08520 [Candidatus Saccharimonadales bacterium]